MVRILRRRKPRDLRINRAAESPRYSFSCAVAIDETAQSHYGAFIGSEIVDLMAWSQSYYGITSGFNQ